MADIEQSLGFNASQAVSSLEQLSFTVDTVNQSIQKLNTTAKGDPTAGVRKGAKDTDATIRRLTRDVDRLADALLRTGREGKKAGDQVTLSWQTFLRVFQTQVLLRGFNELQRQFVETAAAAREFELSVARITTIAGDEAGASFSNIASGVRELAIELGRPLEEVSSAAFQTLQNDVGNVSESLDFLRTSSKLATVQGGELETAMNALTSVFKVYGEDAGNATDAADTFFVAVDKGRITIDQLANRLGTVIGPAEQLGLGFEQVAAAAASLTQTGLDTATATTQLRNIVLKLVRPTKELEVAFKRLGVTTANELVDRNNGELLPTLQDLQRALGGTEEAVAKAFGTFRGQLGVFNLLTQEGKLFSDILDAFPGKAGALEEAFGKVEQTNAREFEKELAQVNDTLVALGETASQLQLGGLQVLNTIIPDAKQARAAIVALGVATVTAFSSSSAAANLFAATLGRVRLATIATTGAIGLLAVAAVNSFPDVDSEIRETSQALERAQEAIRSGENQRVGAAQAASEEIIAQLDEQAGAYTSFFQELDSLYEADQDRYSERADLIGETSRRLLEDFVDSRTDLLDRIDDALGEVDDRIADSVDRYRDAAQRLDDVRFDNALRGLNEVQQAARTLVRAQQTAAQAQQAFAQAGTDEGALAQARELQRLAERQAQTAVRAAERADNQNSVAQARVAQERILTQAVEQQARVVGQLQRLDEERLGTSRDQVALLIEQEKALAQQIQQAASTVTAEGQAKSVEQQLQDQQKINELEQERSEIRSQIAAAPVIEAFGLEKLEADTSAAFERGIRQIQLDTTAAANELEQAITSKTYGIELQIVNPDLVTSQVQAIFDQTSGLPVGERLSARQGALEAFVRNQEQASQTVVTSEESFNAAAAALNGYIQDVGAGRPALDNLSLGLAQLDASLGNLVGNPAFQARLDEQLKKNLGFGIGQEIVQEFNRLSSEGGAAVASVDENIKALNERVQSLGTSGALASGEVRALSQALQTVEQASADIAARDAAQGIIDPQAAREALVTLQNQNQTVDRLKQSVEQGKRAQEGVQRSAQQTVSPLQQANNLWNSIESSIKAAAQASKQIQIPAGGGAGALNQFFGGIVRKNVGGDLTRGQDQTLVAAQEGEFITSARNSQRFFAELRAMNSGQTPVFREQGGPVTNIGDINVNVDARNSQSVDGRQIARTLNRELRRGSSNLRG